MAYHIDGVVCSGCETTLTKVHVELARWFRVHVKPLHHHVHIACGFRGKEDQERAFSEGASLLHFPMSKHNHMQDGVPCSLAVDLFEQINGRGYWRPKTMVGIDAENRTQKLPIKCGTQFKSLGDYNHFELIFPE